MRIKLNLSARERTGTAARPLRRFGRECPRCRAPVGRPCQRVRLGGSGAGVDDGGYIKPIKTIHQERKQS